MTYLFKVLSVRTALSIQAHPNLSLAAKLHASFPDKYKDPNHKPEIAIALSDMEACYGFASQEQINLNLKENPILAEVFPGNPTSDYLKQIVHKMFKDLDTDENLDTRQKHI